MPRAGMSNETAIEKPNKNVKNIETAFFLIKPLLFSTEYAVFKAMINESSAFEAEYNAANRLIDNKEVFLVSTTDSKYPRRNTIISLGAIRPISCIIESTEIFRNPSNAFKKIKNGKKDNKKK